jgi:hypothetical protein
MSPSTLATVLFLLVGCVSAFSSQPLRYAIAQTSERTAPASLRQIVPGHYMYSSATYNSGIITTGDGVVVLDALNSEAVAHAQREATAVLQARLARISVTFDW